MTSEPKASFHLFGKMLSTFIYKQVFIVIATNRESKNNFELEERLGYIFMISIHENAKSGVLGEFKYKKSI